MKKRLLILTFLPLTLLSCNKWDEYYQKDNLFQLSRNGDFFLTDFLETEEYGDLGNNDSASDTLKYVGIGESFNIIRTSKTCASCNSFKDNFIDFIKNTFLDVTVYTSEDSSVTSYVNTLEEHFADRIEERDDCKFMKKTPTWYYGNEKDGIKIANLGSVSKNTLKNNFFKYGSITNLYKFSSIRALEEGLKDKNSLVYLLDETNEESVSFYKENIYQNAIKSNKRTYVVSLGRATSENKEEINSYFSSYSLIYKNEKRSLEDLSLAKAFVNDYYN